ncbi:MAG: type 3 dihydrofolate reductase [Betaproteobacteria bacterium]|nr:type 3 dihydrofolate reductase [Betaproteobacteria bacterium]
MHLNLIVAMAKNRVIGIDNKMPWHLPADFAWFKRNTLGHPVIMGRKTFESIGRPLPGRRNLVVSRNASWQAEGCEAFGSLTAAINQCRSNENVFVIGGATLYSEALPLADAIYLTEVDASPTGDTWFPQLDADQWKERSREHRAADEKNAFAMDFVVLDRIRRL